jgi:hypothetical protein
MKTPLLGCCAMAVLLVAGCGQKSDTAPISTNTASTGSSPMNAPAGYLGALAKGQQAAVATVDTTSIDKAIQMFGVENGRNPKDLNELVQQKFIPKIPDPPYGTKLVYDPASGTVKIVKE